MVSSDKSQSFVVVLLSFLMLGHKQCTAAEMSIFYVCSLFCFTLYWALWFGIHITVQLRSTRHSYVLVRQTVTPSVLPSPVPTAHHPTL